MQGFDWISARDSRHPLRTALIEGAIQALALTERGELLLVPSDLWSGKFLWGEAYSSGLVNVVLEGGLVKGYLCVGRVALEKLWAQKQSPSPQSKSLGEETILAITADCPTVGVAVRALMSDFAGGGRVKAVDTWLREHWPESLNAVWPNREEEEYYSPSLARQINVVIRYAEAFPLQWVSDTPTDKVVAQLAGRLPILAAALEVFRLSRQGVLDHDEGGTVRLARAKSEIAKRVSPNLLKLGAGRRLLECTAQIAIPEGKVSGGGRINQAAH